VAVLCIPSAVFGICEQQIKNAREMGDEQSFRTQAAARLKASSLKQLFWLGSRTFAIASASARVPSLENAPSPQLVARASGFGSDPIGEVKILLVWRPHSWNGGQVIDFVDPCERGSNHSWIRHRVGEILDRCQCRAWWPNVKHANGYFRCLCGHFYGAASRWSNGLQVE